MADVLLGFIQSNSTVDYSFILPLILIYVVLFWLIVSIWVYFDAKKRFKNKKLTILMSIGNFIFQLPFLILYLLFRPIEDEDFESIAQGGVNVPIVNFMGKEGVVMSLELRINQSSIKPDNASEMKIDVSFDSSDSNKVLTQNLGKTELESSNLVQGISSKIKSIFSRPIKKSEPVSSTTVKIEDQQPAKKTKKKNN